MVDRALQRAGGTRLAWVPTVYWTSNKPDKSDVTGCGDTRRAFYKVLWILAFCFARMCCSP